MCLHLQKQDVVKESILRSFENEAHTTNEAKHTMPSG